MASLSKTSSRGVYSLESKGGVATWIQTGLLLAMLLFLKLQLYGRSVVAFFGGTFLFLVGLLALIVWILKAPKARIQTDEDGIATFDLKGAEVCRIEWRDVTSYGSAPTLEGRIEMTVKGKGGQISFPTSLTGFTRLNNAVVRNLPSTIQASNADVRSLVPGATDLSPVGSRKFGRLGYLPTAIPLTGAGVACVVIIALTYDQLRGMSLWMSWAPILFLGLGMPALLIGINERFVVSSEGIVHYDWNGRKKEEIAWPDVLAFQYKRMTSSRGSRTYYYTLLGKANHMNLDSDITNWDDLAKIILTHLPHGATVDFGPTQLPI
jgi:hypothetical protein